MAKVKYYYDSDTLSYKKIENRKRDRLRRALLFLLASALFGFIIMAILLQYIESPKEKVLRRELENLTLNYELLNKRMKQSQEILAELQVRDNNIYRVYFEANPIPDEQRKAGFGGVNRYKSLEGFEYSNLIADATKRMDILYKQIYIQSKSLDEISVYAKDKEKLLAAMPAIQPISNKDLTRMASGYGWRLDPFTKERKFHKGMDFTAPETSPVFATGNGIVQRADNLASGFGNHVRIDHGFEYMTIYAHLSKITARVGQRVQRGDIIGLVGSTGRSQAPHLHYEVWYKDEAVNPINFYYGDLSPEEFQEMLIKSTQVGQTFD